GAPHRRAASARGPHRRHRTVAAAYAAVVESVGPRCQALRSDRRGTRRLRWGNKRLAWRIDSTHCGASPLRLWRHCEPTGPAGSGRPGDGLREAIQSTWPVLDCVVASLLVMTAAMLAPTHASAQGYPGYPYSIMTPEYGAGTHRALRHGRNGAPDTTVTTANAAQPHRASLLGHEKFVAKLPRRGLYAARGSSGVVLPTPLPKTQLIPPEGGGALTLPPMQEEQGPTR